MRKGLTHSFQKGSYIVEGQSFSSVLEAVVRRKYQGVLCIRLVCSLGARIKLNGSINYFGMETIADNSG